ncbi:MAG TPA: hypothetical protein VE075_05220 [Thermoanaerobaculia bacterium]|nr:hypothetical protein [Thermoanaerobaculia bacterium]
MTERSAGDARRQERRERRERREWVAGRLEALRFEGPAVRSPPSRPPGFPRPVAASPAGGRPAGPAQAAASPASPAVVRLAAALPELGPVFCAFGRYLGTRLDLLPESVCQVLAAVPDQAPAMPVEKVRDPLAGIAALEPLPVASTLVYQEHRGRLAGGEPVRVRLVRPELDAELAGDLELLPLLGPALLSPGAAGAGPLLSPAALAAAVDDFGGAGAGVLAAADLSRQGAALLAFGQEAAAAGLPVAPPRLLAELSSKRMLTLAELPGSAPGRGPHAAGELADAADPTALTALTALTTTLCQSWLRQACFGSVLAADFRLADVEVLPDRRLCWTGGTYATLPPGTKGNLWSYLLAAAANEPDRACAALLPELDGGPDDGGSELRHRLRQLVPFRDGGWVATDDLAGYLFLHWRCATEVGYRPRPYLVAFYRGVACLAAAARRLAPQRDALREGLEAARLTAGLGEVTRWLDPQQLRDVLGSYAAVMLAMPQRAEELMSLAASGRINVKVEVVAPEPPAEARRKDSSAASIAVLMAMAAVVLLAHQLSASGVLGPWAVWSERAAAVMVGLLGALLVRAGAARAAGGRRRAGGKRQP